MKKVPKQPCEKYRISEETAYENLANAIIIQAAEDYRAALSGRNSVSVHNIEKFFRSGWFTMLTNVDPETLIERLRKEENDT